ncbi:MAG: PEP-CTERM-box response regulator transcription factor [candidate division Zixibacteria bacterium RBG_16_50_21]|nr:MAG: PEP-CTERM-box response regulator transcription factor [candidate division Zixibacteria bacterium RBG_16_50_21]
MKDRILIIDDEEGIRTQLCWALAGEYEVLQADAPGRALEIVRTQGPQLVLLDIALSTSQAEPDGLELLATFLEIDPLMKIVMVTGHDERANALQAIAKGAYDFYAKPIDLEEIKIIIKRALHIQRLERENQRLSEEIERRHKFQEIIGTSPNMDQIYRTIEKVAPTDATVLVVGESGTGKELAALAIHHLSTRAAKPFVTINCGAIPPNLLESELFGHERGAFTDAHIQRIGKFETSEGGTIFLDEIGELPLQLQVKILRFLQEREIERVGGREPILVDARVIAATNKSLLDEVRHKTFREDLYYRLSVITLQLPPLRERGQDILLLARAFLNRFSAEYNKSKLTFSASSEKALMNYGWPGNVRELENKIRRAVILTLGNKINPYDLGLEAHDTDKRLTLQEIREKTERKHVQEALKRHNWNITNAAKDLGVSRTTLYDIMEKYQIKKEQD